MERVYPMSSEYNDQTIISGLGISSEIDLSISNLSLRPPNATSTAVPNKSREEVLEDLCFKKENQLLNVKLMPPPLSNKIPITKKDKDILKDITHSMNKESHLVNQKKYGSTSIAYKQEIFGLRNSNEKSEVMSISKPHKNSQLFDKVDSMLLNADDELDLKIGTNVVGLPSFLITNSREDIGDRNDGQESFGVWSDRDLQKGLEAHASENHQGTASMKDWWKSHELISEESSSVESICRNYSEDEKYQEPEGEEEVWGTDLASTLEEFLKDQHELSSFVKNEEFHPPDMNEFSENEEEVKKKDEFQIEEEALNSDASVSDFSGVMNVSDVSINPSHWSLGKDFLEMGKKLNIEDIFAAKSCHFSQEEHKIDNDIENSTLHQEIPSSSYEGAQKLKSGNESSNYAFEERSSRARSEVLINLDSSTDDSFGKSTGAIPKKLPSNQVFSVEGRECDNSQIYTKENTMSKIHHLMDNIRQFDLKDDTLNSTFNVMSSKEKSELLINLDNSANDSVNSIGSTGAIPKKLYDSGSFSVECEDQARGQNDTTDGTEDYMMRLRQLFQKASSMYDPDVLIREIFRPNESIDSETTLEVSADVGEMRKLRQNLQSGNTDPNSYSSRLADKGLNQHSKAVEVQEDCLTDSVSTNRGNGRVKMGTSSLITTNIANSSLQKSQMQKCPISKDCLTSIKKSNSPAKVINATGVSGMEVQSEIAVKNPTSKTMTISLKQLNECFDHAASTLANFKFYQFDFDPLHFITPDSYLTIPLRFYSSLPGSFKAKLSLSLCELGVSTDAPWNMDPILTDLVDFCVDVKKIEVSITCDGKPKIDFGLVPEYCLVEKEIKFTNKSGSPLPLLIRVQQITLIGDNLHWVQNQTNVNLISNSLAACELPAQESITVILALRAPSTEDLTSNGIIPVESMVEVLLDTPYDDSYIISRVPVEAHIGEILLRTFRSKLPVTVKSEVGRSGSSSFSLRNKSLFPLHLSVRTTGHESISVPSADVTIPSQDDYQIVVNFAPPHDMGLNKIEGKLIIRVEPLGMEMDLSLLAISTVPEKEVVTEEVPLQKAILEREPVPVHQNKVDKAVCLSSNATTIFFGSEREGRTKKEKFVLYNGWKDNSLSLHLFFQDNEAFSFDVGDAEHCTKKEVAIGPENSLSLNIKFTPTKVDFYSSFVVCKTRGVRNAAKVSIPLYGFGGTGQLLLKREEKIISAENCLSFGKVSPGTPCLLKLTASNIGKRFIFVKLRILPNEDSDSPMSMADLSVQPWDFILGPEEIRDVIVITSGSPSVMQNAPGKIGVLQAVYGDEILRRKFKKHQNSSFKRRKVKDSRLLKMKFEEFITGEKNALCEQNNCPSLPEDPLVFYNSCKNIMIPLTCEVDADPEASTTMIDLILDQDTLASFNCSTSEDLRNVKEAQKKLEYSSISSGSSFGIFPPLLKLTASQKFPHKISVVNFGNETQIFEVSCENKMLCVEPREITVTPMSFSVINVQPMKANIPRNIPKVTCSSFKILGKNHEKEVKVELEIDTNFTFDKFSQGSARVASTLKSSFALKKPLDIPSLVSENVAEYTPKPVVDVKKRNAPQKYKIEVGNEVKFAPTNVNCESVAKLGFKNFDTVSHEVKIVSACQHFYVRHETFSITEQHVLQIPVYFRPKASGFHTEQLSVKTDCGIFKVKLYGRCV